MTKTRGDRVTRSKSALTTRAASTRSRSKADTRALDQDSALRRSPRKRVPTPEPVSGSPPKSQPDSAPVAVDYSPGNAIPSPSTKSDLRGSSSHLHRLSDSSLYTDEVQVSYFVDGSSADACHSLGETSKEYQPSSTLSLWMSRALSPASTTAQNDIVFPRYVRESAPEGLQAPMHYNVDFCPRHLRETLMSAQPRPIVDGAEGGRTSNEFLGRGDKEDLENSTSLTQNDVRNNLRQTQPVSVPQEQLEIPTLRSLKRSLDSQECPAAKRRHLNEARQQQLLAAKEAPPATQQSQSSEVPSKSVAKRSLSNSSEHRGQCFDHYDAANQQSSVRAKVEPLIGNPLLKSAPIDEQLYQELSDLEQYPKALILHNAPNLALISHLARVLRNRVHTFSEKFFSYHLSSNQQAAWPLQELSTRFIALFLSAQYIADGSQAGWRNFFTQPQHRKHLVAGILAEWIVQRVLKHTAFGLDDDDVVKLESLDKTYLHYDAIVRSKKRAEILHEMFFSCAEGARVRKDKIRAAADALAEEILVMLGPLLPPPIYDPLPPKHDTSRQRMRSTARRDCKQELTKLLEAVASFHLSLRLTGSTGTIFRVVPAPAKGTRYHPTASMVCINMDECNQTRPASLEVSSELCIKMTCWPRIEGIVPHGPTLEDLETIESSHGNATDGENFSWDDYEHMWPELPDELQPKVSSTKKPPWRAVMEGSHPKAPPHELIDDSSIKRRAAYMTIYPEICKSSVYVEWTPQPAPESQSLAEVVAEARKQHGLRYKIEDQLICSWNHFVTYNPAYQWAAIIACLVCKDKLPDVFLSTINSATRSIVSIPNTVSSFSLQETLLRLGLDMNNLI